jgi:cyclic pyranopterin phosphate synthase
VLGGLKAAEEAGLTPVKVNCVVVRGTNDSEIVDFARLARKTGYDVRFIEFMPLDADRNWDRSQVVSLKEIFTTIEEAFPLTPLERGVQPATSWAFSDGSPGTVGVIPSVSEPFCDHCNRLRLTADGQMRNCLFSLEETDLRAIIRNGGSDDELEAAIRSSVSAKERGHRINEPDFERPARSMSLIGG